MMCFVTSDTLREQAAGNASDSTRPHRGLNPDIWDENDYAVVDPDINKRLGRIYPEAIRGESRWLWFLQTEPARRRTAKRYGRLARGGEQAFKQRYQEVKGRT